MTLGQETRWPFSGRTHIQKRTNAPPDKTFRQNPISVAGHIPAKFQLFHKPFVRRIVARILEGCTPSVVVDKVSNAFVVEPHLPAFRQWIFFHHIPVSTEKTGPQHQREYETRRRFSTNPLTYCFSVQNPGSKLAAHPKPCN